MKWITYARSSAELKTLRAAHAQEVILSPRALSRWGGLSKPELEALAREARQLDLRPVLEWDILMTEEPFQRARLALKEIDLSLFSAIRVQDPGALHLLLSADRESDLGRIPIQWIAEGGNHNLEALKRWEREIGPRLERMVLSIQLPKAKLQEYISELDVEVEVLGFGPILLLYTPRHLLSSQATRPESTDLFAEASSEESHHTGFRVIENGHGTLVFHEKDYCILEALPELQSYGLQSLRVDLRFEDNADRFPALRSIQTETQAQSFIQAYPRNITRGYFRTNASDTLFKKLKNTEIQRADEGYLGEVVELSRGKYTVVHVLAQKRPMKTGQKLKFVNPEGKVLEWQIEELRTLEGEVTSEIQAGDFGVLPYVKFAAPRTAVYLA